MQHVNGNGIIASNWQWLSFILTFARATSTVLIGCAGLAQRNIQRKGVYLLESNIHIATGKKHRHTHTTELASDPSIVSSIIIDCDGRLFYGLCSML